MIFQDPYASLNPRMRVQDIIGEAPLVHGMTDRAGLADYVDAQMRQAGLDPSTKITGMGSMASPDLVKAGGKAVEGLYLIADWAPGESARVDRSSPISARQIQLIDRPGAKQSTILMGLPLRAITTPGYSDLSQANAILGGAGLLSRLDQNLREEKGWTYGVQTQLEPLQNGSLWMLHADVNTPDTAPALREIFRELARLSGEPLDPQELRRVQNYRAGHFLMGASSREGLIGQLQFVDHHELGADWLPGYLQRLQAVTPEGVRRAAAEIDPSRMTIVVAGDLSRIKSEIDGIEALKGADGR
jgi:predicted Zn-dependent peptidase